MSVLDDVHAMASIDKGDMASQILSAPEQVRETLQTTENLELRRLLKATTDAVFLAGIGGSAIPGDIIKDWAADSLRKPFEVCRAERLPARANKKSLVLVVSYSGETYETLNLFNDAKHRRAKIIVIASGGTLVEKARSARIPVLLVRQALQARAALPSLLTGVVVILGKFRALPNLSRPLGAAADDLGRIMQALCPASSESENRAKQNARLLHDKRVIVYASERLAGVARRMKNQLNELSKLPAVFATLPESAHNEIEAWRELAQARPRTIPVFIDDGQGTREERLGIDTFKLKLGEMGVDSAAEISSDAPDPMLALLSTLAQVDFVAYYIALLRGVDPVAVPAIDSYRKRLAEVVGSKLS